MGGTIADLRAAGIEVSDPRCGALLIGTFCDPTWMAPADNPKVNDHLGALRLDLGLPVPRNRAATPAQKQATLEALADVLVWAEANGLRTGSAWSAGGEGQVANGQMIEVDLDGLMALQEVATTIAQHHGVAYRIKTGPDHWKLIYFTTDPAGSTVTAGGVDVVRHLPATEADLAVAGFHAAVDGWATGFDDTVGFLRKLDRATANRDPKVGAIQLGGRNGFRIGRGQTARERNSAIDSKVADLSRRTQEAERRISELDSGLRARLDRLEQGQVPASDVQALTDTVVAMQADLQATQAVHERLTQELSDIVSRLDDIERRLISVEAAKSTASDTASVAGLHSEAVGAIPRGAPVSFAFNPAGRGGRVPPRPRGGLAAGGRVPPMGGRGGRVPPRLPRATPFGKVPTRPRGGLATWTPGQRLKGDRGGSAPWRPFQAMRDRNKAQSAWRDQVAAWLKRRRQAQKTPWIPAPVPYPYPAPAPTYGGAPMDPMGGGGGGGGGGWGAPGQDFSNYFDDGQDWDGDGISDANAEWLDAAGDPDLEAFLASLSDEELEELLEILAAVDEPGLSQEASAAYLSSLAQGYRGLPPGWRPGAEPHTFIKPDGTPHTFGGGDYNNGKPVAAGVEDAASKALETAADAVESTPEYTDLVDTYVQADEATDLASYAQTLEDEIVELRELLDARDGDVEDLLFDLDGYDPDDAEEYGPTFQEVADWGPIAPPTDVPKPPSFSSQMRWMEYPGN